MSLLRVLGELFGLVKRAAQEDAADDARADDAHRAGRTAGQVAAEAEAAARAARVRLNRCRTCGGTGFLRVHVDDDGAVCPHCKGSGNEPPGPFTPPPPALVALVVALVLPVSALGAPPFVPPVSPPSPPPLYCERVLAEPDPADAAGLRLVVGCERVTAAYQLDKAALALRLAEQKLAAVPEPPSRVVWLLYGAGAAAAVWLGVQVAR